MQSLTEIFDQYDSDKNSKWHNYSRQYDHLLTKFRDKPVRLLELGVLEGESLKIWKHCFLNSQCIVGVDIDPRCIEYNNNNNGIFVEIGNATDIKFIEYLNTKYGPFDIIIDDASHINRDVILSFEGLFPLLSDGGIYVVEDTVVCNHPQFHDNRYPNHLEYFHKYTYGLNWTVSQEWCVDPFKLQYKTNNVFKSSIDCITFGVSFVAINKLIRHNWLL
jgi:spermidine synthase